MSSTLTLNVATFTSAVNLNATGKTDTEIGQILRWFVIDKASPPPDGLTQAQTNQYYLDQAREEIMRYVVREARKNRLRDLQSQQQSIEAQADKETNL